MFRIAILVGLVMFLVVSEVSLAKVAECPRSGVQFFDNSSAEGEPILFLPDEPVSMPLKKKKWNDPAKHLAKGDRIRSARLNCLREGTIIEVTDDRRGRRHDDWAKIIVQKGHQVYDILSFEPGRGAVRCDEEGGTRCARDNVAKIIYGYRDNLDGNISFIRISRQRTGSCHALPSVSEESSSSRVQCGPGSAVVGIQCRGKYCDDKVLTCCSVRGGTSAQENWSRFFSDEEREMSFVDGGDFVAGIECRGKYCDQMSLLRRSGNSGRHGGRCYRSNRFSEERGGTEECRNGYFLSGIECDGKYCDNLTLVCCAP